MATSTQSKNGAPPFEAAFEQIKDLNEQWLAAARKAGNLYVDSYEKAVDRAIQFEQKIGDMSHQEWLKSLIDAQVELARELTTSYTTSARSLLK
jgi:hypothetical protein